MNKSITNPKTSALDPIILNKLLEKCLIDAKTRVVEEGSYFVLELPVINLQKLY